MFCALMVLKIKHSTWSFSYLGALAGVEMIKAPLAFPSLQLAELSAIFPYIFFQFRKVRVVSYSEQL